MKRKGQAAQTTPRDSRALNAPEAVRP